MRSTSVVLILILLTTSLASAQHQPNAEMIDEIGPVPCEYLIASIDALAGDLQLSPGTRASFYMFRPKVNPRLSQLRRTVISSTLQLNGVDPGRYTFHDSSSSPDGEIRTQVWKVPPGALEPGHPSTVWNEPSPDTSKQFLFGTDNEIRTCPTFVPKAFAKLIKDNPGSHGKIIVRDGGTPMNKFAFAAWSIKQLVDKQGIPRRRLKLVFKKNYNLETIAEYWFIPVRRSRRR